MDYFPNVDAVVHFCTNVFPRIRAQVPEARFVPAPPAGKESGGEG